MVNARFHPFASLSIASFVVSIVLPYFAFGLQPSFLSQLSLLVLASPFVVLVAAHRYASRTWRRNLAVALCNVPLWLGWLFCAVLMWYFRPGLPGAVFLGALLSLAAGVLLLSLRLISEPISPNRA